MRFGVDLTTKALLALEEVTQDCRYCVPDRTFAIRFALAYLYALKPGDPDPYVDFWRAIAGENDVFRFQFANRELDRIYRKLGLVREDPCVREIWEVAQARAERRSEK
jgi:hypothetical protein